MFTKQKIKYISYILFALFSLFAFNSNIYAFNEYGIYCEYGDYHFKYYGENSDILFDFDDNFDELGVSIEEGRPGKVITDSSEQDWLKSKGLIQTVNSYEMFSCPENPFGTSLGKPTYKEYGKNNGLIDKIESNYESYSCHYVGAVSNKTLDLTYIYSGENGQNIEITYPDGYKKTLTTNQQFMGNTFPSSACEDIYYIYKDDSIHSIRYNDNIFTTNNQMLYELCQKYNQDEIEHFCSGTCTYQEMVCSSTMIDWDKIDEDCEGILGDELIEFFNKIFHWIQIIAPIFVIIMGGVEFAGAVLQDDKDALKKASSKFIKRLIIAVALFFIPLILSWLLNIFNDISGTATSTCGIGE